MKLITTAAASAMLFVLSSPAVNPAQAESITLKRTGASARSDRAHNADEEGATEDSASLGAKEEAAPRTDPNDDDAGSGGWAYSSEDEESPDTESPRETRAARRLIIVGSQHRRHQRRRHCVESTWSSCGEPQRTLWILN